MADDTTNIRIVDEDGETLYGNFASEQEAQDFLDRKHWTHLFIVSS